MRKHALLVICLLLLLPQLTRATEEYAAKTGRPCAECHEDPAGGGTLTPVGASFAKGGYVWPVVEDSAPGAKPGWFRVTRFILGFLHLLSAVSWLGTIFYVHIVLRPRYALGGLPKMEMRIAWGAMAILAATGVPLTKMRFHDPAALLQTRSGILLLVKIGLFLLLLISAAYVTLVLSKKLKSHRSKWQDNNGMDGRPAWVKVENRLYDFSESRRWVNGNHFGRHQAGQDLTEALKTAPHGPEKLSAFASFSLADNSLGSETKAVKLLYFLAYMNLFAALGVIVVIALWRWG